MSYYAENGEDKWIDAHLTLPAKGVYVDVGAGHPRDGSNTAWLREKGWTGLPIDANEAYRSAWLNIAREAPFTVALIALEPYVRFKFNHENVGISRADPNGKEHSAVKLQTLLDAYSIKQIDFLSIDVEGMEFDILRSFRWADYMPKVIIAEYNTAGIGEDYRVRDLLTGTGAYTEVHQTLANIVYVPTALKEAMSK